MFLRALIDDVIVNDAAEQYHLDSAMYILNSLSKHNIKLNEQIFYFIAPEDC